MSDHESDEGQEGSDEKGEKKHHIRDAFKQSVSSKAHHLRDGAHRVKEKLKGKLHRKGRDNSASDEEEIEPDHFPVRGDIGDESVSAEIELRLQPEELKRLHANKVLLQDVGLEAFKTNVEIRQTFGAVDLSDLGAVSDARQQLLELVEAQSTVLTEKVRRYLAEDDRYREVAKDYVQHAALKDSIGVGSIALGVGLAVASHGGLLPLTIIKLVREVVELGAQIHQQAQRGETLVGNLLQEPTRLAQALEARSGEITGIAVTAGKQFLLSVLGLGEWVYTVERYKADLGDLKLHIVVLNGLAHRLAHLAMHILALQDEYKREEGPEGGHPGHEHLKTIRRHYGAFKEEALDSALNKIMKHVELYFSKQHGYREFVATFDKSLEELEALEASQPGVERARKIADALGKVAIAFAVAEPLDLLKETTSALSLQVLEKACDERL